MTRRFGAQRQQRTATVVSSRWLDVHRDTVVDEETGRQSEYWVVRRPSFVVVIPRRAGGREVGLVRTYRYPVGRFFWEFPQRRLPTGAGPGEVDATATAVVSEIAPARTVHRCELVPVGRFYEAYGFADHLGYCVVADIEAGDADAGAPNQVRWFEIDDLRRSLADVGVLDAATLAAMTLLETHRPGGGR